jgi:hypothetical protein
VHYHSADDPKLVVPNFVSSNGPHLENMQRNNHALHLSKKMHDRIAKRKGQSMSTELEKLIEAARLQEFPAAEREAQRRSFAYGNTHIENARITRQMIDDQAELLRTEACNR